MFFVDVRCKMVTLVRQAFQNTMEEAFSALHCPNCEEFRRLRDFSQGRPAVNLSEVGKGRREELKNLRAANAKPVPACTRGTLQGEIEGGTQEPESQAWACMAGTLLGVKLVFITVPRLLLQNPQL